MESKQFLVLLFFCAIVNGQIISSVRKTTKIHKFKLPGNGCQCPVGMPCGCDISPNSPYNCGCANPGLCGCQKIIDQREIPSCSLEMPAAFAMDIPYNFGAESYGYSPIITVPYDYFNPIETKPCGCPLSLNPCGCQTAGKPSQMPIIQPTNIFDFLAYLDALCGSPNSVRLAKNDYIPCGCGIPQCRCQVPRDAVVCGCLSGTVAPNTYQTVQPASSVIPGIDGLYLCGCQGRYYTPDVLCACHVSSQPCTCQMPCNCGCQRCGFGCGCGCGKYLRQVTLQPPFL